MNNKKKNMQLFVTEARGLLFFSVVITFFFIILFYKGNFMSNIYLSLTFIYLFIVPGYFIGLNLKYNSVVERTILGIMGAIAFTGILNYALGLYFIKIQYHVFIIPLLIIVSALILKENDSILKYLKK